MNIKINILSQIWATGSPAAKAQALTYLPTLPATPERLAGGAR